MLRQLYKALEMLPSAAMQRARRHTAPVIGEVVNQDEEVAVAVKQYSRVCSLDSFCSFVFWVAIWLEHARATLNIGCCASDIFPRCFRTSLRVSGDARTFLLPVLGAVENVHRRRPSRHVRKKRTRVYRSSRGTTLWRGSLLCMLARYCSRGILSQRYVNGIVVATLQTISLAINR